jgi:predicted nucleic acid-binding protein
VSLVLDSSVTVAWLYREEKKQIADEIFAILIDTGAWVPSLWYLEVANVLQTGIRRQRHGADFRERIFSDLLRLPIRVDAETHQQAWGETAHFAERHRLTTYDAAYLELAIRRGMPLATFDEDLRKAAASEGIELLGE